jgi:hypothetical protein
MILVLLFQRRIVSGLTAGAVKDKEKPMAQIALEQITKVDGDGYEAVELADPLPGWGRGPAAGWGRGSARAAGR